MEADGDGDRKWSRMELTEAIPQDAGKSILIQAGLMINGVDGEQGST